METFDSYITAQNWDHVKFLRYLLIIMVSILLLFMGWIFYLGSTGLFHPEFLSTSLKNLGIGTLLGGIIGILVGFIILLPKYVQKQWDLHDIFPYFLLIHLTLSIIIAISSIWIQFPALFETSFLIGFIIGGLLSLLAYGGEVKKEHSDQNLPLIEDEL